MSVTAHDSDSDRARAQSQAFTARAKLGGYGVSMYSVYSNRPMGSSGDRSTVRTTRPEPWQAGFPVFVRFGAIVMQTIVDGQPLIACMQLANSVASLLSRPHILVGWVVRDDGAYGRSRSSLYKMRLKMQLGFSFNRLFSWSVGQ